MVFPCIPTSLHPYIHAYRMHMHDWDCLMSRTLDVTRLSWLLPHSAHRDRCGRYVWTPRASSRQRRRLPTRRPPEMKMHVVVTSRLHAARLSQDLLCVNLFHVTQAIKDVLQPPGTGTGTGDDAHSPVWTRALSFTPPLSLNGSSGRGCFIKPPSERSRQATAWCHVAVPAALHVIFAYAKTVMCSSD
jgi:hypothetical protein